MKPYIKKVKSKHNINGKIVNAVSYYNINKTKLLYHTTDVPNFKLIMRDGILKPQVIYSEGKLISFSMDRNFRYGRGVKFEFILKNIPKRIRPKPVLYYDPILYKKDLKKITNIKEKKRMHDNEWLFEREWQTRYPIPLNNRTLNRIILIVNYDYDKNPIKDPNVKLVRDFANKIGVKFSAWKGSRKRREKKKKEELK